MNAQDCELWKLIKKTVKMKYNKVEESLSWDLPWGDVSLLEMNL
jgi:hypothetical protein